MAASPRFKVYRDGKYVASCKYPSDAGAIIAMSGGQMRDRDHKTVIFDDPDGTLSGESYDEAAIAAENHDRRA